jgi:hypothetical protein
MTAILKVCTCGARYSASQWNDLHLVGPLTGGGEDGDEVIGELRNCAACLSTIAVTVEDIADAETIPPPASGHARAVPLALLTTAGRVSLLDLLEEEGVQ